MRRKESLPFGRTLDPYRRHFMQSLVRAPYNSGSNTKRGFRDIAGRIVEDCHGFVGNEVYGRSLGPMPPPGYGD